MTIVIVVVTLGMIAQIGIIFINATCRTTAQGGIMNDVAVETSGIVVCIATHEVTALGAIIIIASLDRPMRYHNRYSEDHYLRHNNSRHYNSDL
jgi:hypothetical protein